MRYRVGFLKIEMLYLQSFYSYDMGQSVFISYSRRDIARVQSIRSAIEDFGVSCWMDLNNIESGSASYSKDIVEGINGCEAFLFMLSKNSQASQFALSELGLATDKRKHVVIVNIDGCQPSDEFRLLYGLRDWIDWNDIHQRDKLFRDLKKWVKTDGGKAVVDKVSASGPSSAQSERERRARERAENERMARERRMAEARARAEMARQEEAPKEKRSWIKPIKSLMLVLGIIAVIVFVVSLVLSSQSGSSYDDQKYRAIYEEKVRQAQEEAQEQARAESEQLEREEDEAYQNCLTIEDCDEYLDRYPYGRYVAEVEAKRNELIRLEETPSIPVETPQTGAESNQVPSSNYGSSSVNVNVRQCIGDVNSGNSITITGNGNVIINGQSYSSSSSSSSSSVSVSNSNTFNSINSNNGNTNVNSGTATNPDSY